MKFLKVTEVFRLSVSYIVLNILGIKIKSRYGDLLYLLLKLFRGNDNKGVNNKIIFTDNGQEKIQNINKRFKNFCVNFVGDNNTLVIDKSAKLWHSIFVFDCSNSIIRIDKNVCGVWEINIHGNGCSAKIGKNTECTQAAIFLSNNSIQIGENCLLSNNIRIITDRHSVLDKTTNQVLNIPKEPIIIGNHVWIGERVTLTKNAQIPDNCIVGIASVVTKAFSEQNCTIAGAPAKICKKGITWNKTSPVNFINQKF